MKKTIVQRQETHADLLVRFFQDEDGGVIGGHPYISFVEEQRADSWYTVARQRLPLPTWRDTTQLAHLDRLELGVRGPLASAQDARRAGILWDDELISSMYRRFDETYLDAHGRAEIAANRAARLQQRLAGVR